MHIKDSGSRESWATGARRDQREGKGRYDLIPPEVPALLARVLEAGARKYGDGNWEKGMPLPRCLDSLVRHLNQFQAGERDEDHLAHALANLAFLVAYRARIQAGNLPRSLDEQGYLGPPGESSPETPAAAGGLTPGDVDDYFQGVRHVPTWVRNTGPLLWGGAGLEEATGGGSWPSPGPTPQPAPSAGPTAPPARRKVVYVSGPYSDPRGAWYVSQNIHLAREVTAALWGVEGVVPLCPHLNSEWMDGLVPRETFITGDLELVARCDAMLMVGRWGESAGALEEFAEARRLGKRVFFSWPAGLAQVREWARGDA